MPQMRYSTGAIILHWLIAISVIANWRIASAAEHASKVEHASLMATHKSLGITILILTLLRLGWRAVKTPPPLAPTLHGWERALARTVHMIFYALLIGMPLAGWFASSLFGKGVDVFGLFTLPAFPVGKNAHLGGQIFEAHATAGTIFLLLIALHVIGALKHHFYDKDGNLYRMLPFGTPKA